MVKKNWIEFDNQAIKKIAYSETDNFSEISNIKIERQKKGKRGKTITLIQGLGIEDKAQIRELLKRMKVFCGTGGTLNGNNIQLQGDMVIKSIDFLHKEGFKNL